MSTALFLGEAECLLLAVMAFDRYVAICLPLRYTVIMSWKICKNTTVFVWVGSFLSTTLPTIVKPAVFCRENKVNHFLCEVLAILKLACGDTSTYEVTIFLQSLLTIFAPFAFIVVSYICIVISVLKIHSVDGRSKAFSTCVSHLTVVLMFYGTSMTMYLGPTNHFSPNQEKYFAVIYGIVTPMLNPLIYSLRNNEVKVAVRKILNTKHSTHL
ncbi:olfactory receptor 2A7-like [Rhinophrynus dorsalis]